MAEGRPSTETAASAAPEPRRPQADPGDQLQVALGWAVHGRADDVVVAVRDRLEQDSGPAAITDPEVYALIAKADRLATRVIGRWIATGNGASGEETQTLAALGEAVEVFSLPRMLKAYFAWRDATRTVLREEAERLEVPGQVARQLQAMVEQSCDASLVQMSRHFDRQRLSLQGELAAERAKLAHLALHDSLTGLANRTLLFERLSDGLESSVPVDKTNAVLYLDLDEFKAVNDTFGHDAGDMVLVALAARLRNAVRPTDTVARCGGDEFVIFCPGLAEGVKEAERLAQRLMDSIQRPFSLQDNDVTISGSIGIAVAATSDEAERLLCQADAEMYVAKQRGGAQCSVSAGP